MARFEPRLYPCSARRDTILVQTGDDDDLMSGLHVARVAAFLAFTHENTRYPCSLVEWFNARGDSVDPIVGMWVVEPEYQAAHRKGQPRRRSLGLIHLDTVVRACHLTPVLHKMFLPATFRRSDTLTAFNSYYLNKYADYHTYEVYPKS